MKTDTLDRIAADLLNGNLKDAKRSAKRASATELGAHFRESIGMSDHRATTAAHYLKNPTQATWQQFCDSK